MKIIMTRLLLIIWLVCFVQIAVGADQQTNLIDINMADIETLVELDGVGQARAQAIIDYREKNGPFSSIDELVSVKGIGESLLEKNRDRLAISSSTGASD